MNDDQEPRWEKVAERTKCNGEVTWAERLPVPGGWLYVVEAWDDAQPVMCFVPDYSERQPEPERWRQVADRLAAALDSLLKKPDARELRISDPDVALAFATLAKYRRAVTEENEGAP